jgi:hypothetical protein
LEEANEGLYGLYRGFSGEALAFGKGEVVGEVATWVREPQLREEDDDLTGGPAWQ